MARPVAVGPLAVRWHGCSAGAARAGAAAPVEVTLENAGTVPWRSHGAGGIRLAYHWLDERGNAIVWDGIRTAFPHPVAPGERVTVTAPVRAPLPPGRYRLAFDIVDETRLWFSEVGNAMLDLDVQVGPRIERALAARGGERAALASQDEPLVEEADAAAVAFLADGCEPAPDWSRRLLDAHQEGFAVVGGAIVGRRGLLGRPPEELAPWSPGRGRVPGFEHPLLCPSIVRDVEPVWLEPIAGLPAVERPGDGVVGEPWIYDGRIEIRLRR